MRSELGDFPGRFLTHVNRDPDDDGKGAHKNERDDPGGNMPDPESAIKIERPCDCGRGMQKDFGDPRHQTEDENKNVIPFQPSSDGLELADFKTGKDEVFAHEFLPFALEKVAIFHDHRDQKMSFQHSNPGPEGIIEPITSGFDPEQHPKDSEIKKENNVRHFAAGESDCNDGGAAGNGPVCGHIEPLPPDHDSPHFAAVKMRHGIDISRVVKAALDGNRRLLGCRGCAVFSCHGYSVNRITAAESNISCFGIFT